jgi:hypothetical protein
MAKLTIKPETQGHEHCENCGRLDPGTDQGYTGCCNEPTCQGTRPVTWNIGTCDEAGRHTVTGTFEACCGGAVAGEGEIMLLSKKF